jgi:hypothetical protein
MIFLNPRFKKPKIKPAMKISMLTAASASGKHRRRRAVKKP